MNEYPLHRLVFENDLNGLSHYLKQESSKVHLEQKDLRFKTPLELAIMLNHFECAKLLCEHGADCCLITKAGWNLVQEAVSTGNADLIRLIMKYRDYQRNTARMNGIAELLRKLKQSPDFYVEMRWEFTSWIPLVSKVCPNDVYKIYKSGSNVRIDTTLIGFNGTTWQRGNRTYIFQADADANATFIEIDHMKQTYHIDRINTTDDDDENTSSTDFYEPDDYVIEKKLSSPNMVTYLDIEKIEFERNQSGIWGWRTEKTEIINDFQCKVYTANNLQLLSKTRVEHLNDPNLRGLVDSEEMDMQRQSTPGNLPGFLSNIFKGNVQKTKIEKSNKVLTSREYFQKQTEVDYFLNGSVRNIDETCKIQSFNATLSLSDLFPLSLQDQVLPIVDLMAVNNSHFKKLKEFITLQLPSGFPVKIEIPVYRVITAKVTFENIHALSRNVTNVRTEYKTASLPRDPVLDLEDDSSDRSNLIKSSKMKKSLSSTLCIVDPKVFEIPEQYRCINLGIANEAFAGAQRNLPSGNIYSNRSDYLSSYQVDEEDILLQLAIQQSLNQETDYSNEQVTALEMFGTRSSNARSQSQTQITEQTNELFTNSTQEDLILQRVLAESIVGQNATSSVLRPVGLTNEDATLESILQESLKEEQERQRRLQLQEEEELQKILELSLIEK